MKRTLLTLISLSLLAFLSGCSSNNNRSATYLLSFTVISVLFFLFIMLGIYTNMLRDEVNDCDQFNANAAKIEKRIKHPLLNKEYPFSLAKVQLAGWTLIIASSYIYFYLCKGDCTNGDISKTALILMGIGAGSATASSIIDKREIQNNIPRHQNQPSEGFFTDILSDYNGISIHRFQNFVWTVIAMVIYITKVAHVQKACELPELSDTILILTGISGATYLTLRAGENRPNIQEVQQQGQPA